MKLLLFSFRIRRTRALGRSTWCLGCVFVRVRERVGTRAEESIKGKKFFVLCEEKKSVYISYHPKGGDSS